MWTGAGKEEAVQGLKKKKKEEASKVCAFEGLQVISGGWKMRRENER